MKPPAFEYLRPSSLDEALAMLAERGDEAKVLAGGQSLVPLMNFRLARPECLIDLNRIPALAYLRRDEDSTLRIGAMTRMAQIEHANGSLGDLPILPEAVRLVGHFQIRNRGTAGGSTAHADPAAELPAVLLALAARLVLRSERGERVVGVDDFFLGPFTTAVEPDEILTEIQIPHRSGTGAAIEEFARRPGDFALAGAVCRVARQGQSVDDVRLALFGVASTPIRLEGVEQRLRGAPLDPATVRDVVEAELREVPMVADVHAGEEYRRTVAAELATSAVMRAGARAMGGESA